MAEKYEGYGFNVDVNNRRSPRGGASNNWGDTRVNSQNSGHSAVHNVRGSASAGVQTKQNTHGSSSETGRVAVSSRFAGKNSPRHNESYPPQEVGTSRRGVARVNSFNRNASSTAQSEKQNSGSSRAAHGSALDRQSLNSARIVARGQKNPGNAGVSGEDYVNRNARRIDLTEEQKINYERAYREKYGRSPYVNRPSQNSFRENYSGMSQASSRNNNAVRPQTSARANYGDTARNSPRENYSSAQSTPRMDRRQAYLRDEEERLRREAEAARREEERLREEQAAARRAAEAERRKREAAARRAAEERVREAERRNKELKNRLAYEESKKEYARQLRIEAQREKTQRRKKLERKLKRRRFVRQIGFFVRVILATVLVTAMVFGALAYQYFWVDKKPVSRSVTYLYGDVKISGVAKEQAYCEGVMCVDLIRIAEMFGFYTIGDSQRVKFIIPDETMPQYITIIPDSLYVEINGTPVVLSVPSRYEGKSLWVSSEIMSFFEKGVAFETKNSGNASIQKVISRDENGDPVFDAEKNLVYDKVLLSYKYQHILEAPDLSVIYGDESLGIGVGTKVTFNTELEGFETYMNPPDSTLYLVLANKQNLLASDYIPEALTDAVGTRDDGRKTVQLCLYAAKALEAMLIEMKDAGYGDVSVTEGYVSYQAQVDEFNARIADEMAKGYSENEAMRQVLTSFAAPGTNEHQTGLAVDIHNLPSEDVAFAEEEAFLWLKDNSWKFGYVLRYPEGKEDMTGRTFEPWHFRYVGRYAAEKMYKGGLTLEEYLNGDR